MGKIRQFWTDLNIGGYPRYNGLRHYDAIKLVGDHY